MTTAWLRSPFAPCRRATSPCVYRPASGAGGSPSAAEIASTSCANPSLRALRRPAQSKTSAAFGVSALLARAASATDCRPLSRRSSNSSDGELDRGAGRDAGAGDDGPVPGPLQDVPQPHVAVQLGLGEGVALGQRLELLVVHGNALEAELLQVDLLGGPSVDLLQPLAVGAGDDRGNSAGTARLGVADAERPPCGDGHRDHAVRGRLAAVEVALIGTAGGAAGEGNSRSRRLVGPSDRVGDVALARVDEQQHQVGFPVEPLEGPLGAEAAGQAKVVARLGAGADAGADPGAESHRDATLVQEAVAGEQRRGR